MCISAYARIELAYVWLAYSGKYLSIDTNLLCLSYQGKKSIQNEKKSLDRKKHACKPFVADALFK